MDSAGGKLDHLIAKSNEILNVYREETSDALLSPFKGNRKDGTRRRRLDYSTARAILESAHQEIVPNARLFQMKNSY